MASSVDLDKSLHSSDFQRGCQNSQLIDSKTLPALTSEWKKDNLHELKIQILEGRLNPKDVVTKIVNPELCDILKPGLASVANAMESTLRPFSLLDTTFDNLTVEDEVLKQLSTYRIWDIQDQDDNPKMNEMRMAFKICGKKFTEMLIYCISHKDSHGTVSEYMYQHLFISFLELFNLRCHEFAPFTTRTMMQINGRHITGMPDVKIKLMRQNTDEVKPAFDLKTLVVCKMKKNCEREDASPPKRTRICSEPDNAVRSSLPDDVLGQHAAELLLCYPSSVNSDYIIGMIVEQTKVTFVALSITREQYQEIMNGSVKDHPKGPKLYVTESYDYLKREDRRHLLEALLMLGYLQNYGSGYFQ